jgi:RNA polymerase sigma-70 factor (ECF subfamily)
MADIPLTSDDELISRARTGDGEAFHALARTWSAPLYRSALALSRDRQLAEDIAQETLLEAWRSIQRFDGRCRFSTWLYGILRHRFLKALRQRSRHGSVELTSNEREPATGHDADPVLSTQQAETAARLRTAVARLPDGHREVIELRFFADASLEDIATALDLPLGTVKSRLHHALEKLRQQKLLVNLVATSGDSSSGPP